MAYLISTSPLKPIEIIGQGESFESRQQSPDIASIHILDDNSLLNVFHLYRPFLLGEGEDDDDHLLGGKERWDRERWWYRLAHICRRWRDLILASASYLGLCLACTFGTPVADMLAHSPHLPLVVDYQDKDRDPTVEDEEGIMFALEQRGRVRRIRIWMHAPNLQKVIMAIDEEYPILEHLIMGTSPEDSTALTLSKTLQAPHLRHLLLIGVALPMGSRLLTTAVGLITLGFLMTHPSTYIQPNNLLQWLASTPQLESLIISFSFAVPKRDVASQLAHTPNITHVTLPNLRNFWFEGTSAYLEGVVHRLTTPRLEKLEISFFKQLTFSIPRLLQFLNRTENFRFDSVKFEFSRAQVCAAFYPREKTNAYSLSIYVDCWHLDWQVSSMAQIFNSLSQISFAVEHLIFEHEIHGDSSEEHNKVNRTVWHKLLMSFKNVKTLRVDDGLVGGLSRCLRLENGELSLELLPELQELTYSGNGEGFTSFIDARQYAGRPVTLIHHKYMFRCGNRGGVRGRAGHSGGEEVVRGERA